MSSRCPELLRAEPSHGPIRSIFFVVKHIDAAIVLPAPSQNFPGRIRQLCNRLQLFSGEGTSPKIR